MSAVRVLLGFVADVLEGWGLGGFEGDDCFGSLVDLGELVILFFYFRNVLIPVFCSIEAKTRMRSRYL